MRSRTTRCKRVTLGALASVGTLVGGCGGRPAVFEWTTLGDGLRVDLAQGVIELDGEISVDTHHPDTPTVWLELFVTAPDSREYESLVVTRVRPSLIHAAVLATGAEPGGAGRVGMLQTGEVVRTQARGDEVRIEFVLGEGSRESVHDPAAWVEHVETGEVLAGHAAWEGFVFAGSREVTRQGRVWYDADGTGVIVGLTTFGSEVIAPALTLSPEAEIDATVWVARPNKVPDLGVPVRVRVWLTPSE